MASMIPAPSRILMILVVLVSISCALSGKSGEDRHPYELTRRYLDALRWKNYQAASKFWLPTRQDKWLEDHEADEDMVNYQGFQVRAFKPLEQGKKMEARIRAELYRNDQLVVKKKTLLLTWEKVGERWFIIKEAWKD